MNYLAHLSAVMQDMGALILALLAGLVILNHTRWCVLIKIVHISLCSQCVLIGMYELRNTMDSVSLTKFHFSVRFPLKTESQGV